MLSPHGGDCPDNESFREAYLRLLVSLTVM